jgi:hypothetical protein
MTNQYIINCANCREGVPLSTLDPINGLTIQELQAKLGEACPGHLTLPEFNPHLSLSAEDELAQWWRDQAESEISQTVAKSVEYGAYDLIVIGHTLGHAIGWEGMTDREATYVGAFFYLQGKVARMASAITEKRLPSDDTDFDTGVYVRMMQRAKQKGGWPG